MSESQASASVYLWACAAGEVVDASEGPGLDDTAFDQMFHAMRYMWGPDANITDGRTGKEKGPPPFQGTHQRILERNTPGAKGRVIASPPVPKEATGGPRRPPSAAARAAKAAGAIRSSSQPDTSDATAAPTATPATTSSPQPTSQPQQFADDDPDSPYAIHIHKTKEQMLYILDKMMLREFERRYDWAQQIVVPPIPATKKAAAKLQQQVDKLLAAGRAYHAVPWQCQLALYSIYTHGVDSGDISLRAVYDFMKTVNQSGSHFLEVEQWLLPRIAKLWGLGHPDTRQLVVWCAEFLRTRAFTHGSPSPCTMWLGVCLAG